MTTHKDLVELVKEELSRYGIERHQLLRTPSIEAKEIDDKKQSEYAHNIISLVFDRIKGDVLGAIDEQYSASIEEESLPEEHKHGEKWFLFNLRTQITNIINGYRSE